MFRIRFHNLVNIIILYIIVLLNHIVTTQLPIGMCLFIVDWFVIVWVSRVVIIRILIKNKFGAQK